MIRRIEIIVNPASGSKLSLSLAEQYIKPLLRPLTSHDMPIRQTQNASDGIRIGDEIARDLLSSSGHSVLDLVLIGGDGTTHELLNGLYLLQSDTSQPCARKRPLKVRLAIVPAGTANALYSAMYPDSWTQEIQDQVANASSLRDVPEEVIEVMLQSVRSLVSHQTTVALPLMLNKLEADEETETWWVSHLVTSHALHASIVHDADTPEMREKHKGIERFKVAAQNNAVRWTYGRLMLEGGERGVQRYSPKTQRFEVVQGKEVLEGPFLYLNAMVTDRLESAFIPAPLSSAFSPTNPLPLDAIDLVVIRPRRDVSISAEAEDQAAVQFATTKLGEITTGMYSGGKHVELVYAKDEPVVEYLRCEGYGFVPEAEGKARLVCTDGFVSSARRTVVRRWMEGRRLGRWRRGEEGEERNRRS